MSEQDFEPQESIDTPDESVGTESAMEATEPQGKSREELEQENKRLYAQYKTEKEKRQELEQKVKKPVVPQSKQPVDQDYIEDVLNLRVDGYSKDEIDYIKKYARGAEISLAEAANDPVLIAGIKARRAETRSEEATPAPSHRAPLSQPKKTWASMSEEERKANFGQMVNKFKK